MKLTQEEFDSAEWRDGFQRALCFSFRDTIRRVKALVCLVTLLCIGAAAAFAQEPQPDQSTDSLAKQAQNPVAHMISVPFQNNFNFGAGTKSDFQNVLNIQPVVPFRLSERWTLITRTIIPVVRQPVYGDGLDEKFGLGDVQMSFFLSPAKAGKVLWGVGPIVRLGKQAVNIQAQAFYNVTHPDRAAMWSLRLQFQLLFSAEADSPEIGSPKRA